MDKYRQYVNSLQFMDGKRGTLCVILNDEPKGDKLPDLSTSLKDEITEENFDPRNIRICEVKSVASSCNNEKCMDVSSTDDYIKNEDEVQSSPGADDVNKKNDIAGKKCNANRIVHSHKY